MSLNITVRVNDITQVTKGVMTSLRNSLRERLPGEARGVREDLLVQLFDHMRSTSTVNSVLHGELRENFGLADPDGAIDDVLFAVAEGVRVNVKPGRGNSLGGLEAMLLPDGLAPALSSRGASYQSNGNLIPWLEWLLMGGSGIILADVQMDTSRATRKASRTGRAIMVRPTKKPSRGWGVPAQWAGSSDDNFLTRALEGFAVKAQDLLSDAIRRAL